MAYSSFDPFETEPRRAGDEHSGASGARGAWSSWPEPEFQATTQLVQVGPPFEWLAIAGAVALVGGTVALLWGAAPALAFVAWALAGPAAVLLLAVFSLRDVRRQAAPVYTAPPWASAAYWGVVVLVAAAVVASAWQIGQWSGRVMG